MSNRQTWINVQLRILPTWKHAPKKYSKNSLPCLFVTIFMARAEFFQDWLPLELTHPNFRVKKFSHACQLSYETSTIPIGQVVQVQDFFKWKNTIKSCIFLGVKILKKMVHIQRNLGKLYRGRSAMGLKYVVAGLSVMAKSDVSARNSLHITPSGHLPSTTS